MLWIAVSVSVLRGRESVGERGGGAEGTEIYFKDLSLSCGTQNPYIYIYF